MTTGRTHKRDNLVESELPNLHGKMLRPLKAPLEDLAQHDLVKVVFVEKSRIFKTHSGTRGLFARPLSSFELNVTYRGKEYGQHLKVLVDRPPDIVTVKNYIDKLTQEYKEIL